MRSPSNAARNAPVTRISDWPAGSPPETKKMTGNMLNVQIVPRRITVWLTGRRPGMVTLRNRCHGEAPSSAAAS